MSNLIRTALKNRVYDFKSKTGRVGRSRFFTAVCLVLALCIAYMVILGQFVSLLDFAGLPWYICAYIRYFGIGAMLVVLALGTRRLRRKRLRDIGWPLFWDWPFLFLLALLGFAPFFRLFDLPVLAELEVFMMPVEALYRLLGIFMIWLIVMILAPSNRRFRKTFTFEDLRLEQAAAGKPLAWEETGEDRI